MEPCATASVLTIIHAKHGPLRTDCMILIVNADDLGASERINEETFSLMKSGLVTSATIIANAPAFEHAAARVRDFPGCSFGVHLNLTALPPVAPSDDLQPVLDENGNLSRRLLCTPLSRRLRAALLRELTMQVRRILDFGIVITHFDSHQHVHTVPQLFWLIKSLQRRFGVRKVRMTRNLFSPDREISKLQILKKKAFGFALRQIYTTRSTEGFGEFRDFYASLTMGHAPRFRSLELMVHPGTSYPPYNEEVELLRSDWRRFLPESAHFASYHSI